MSEMQGVPYIPPLPFSESFAIQLRVIGALIIRELHTRFGRDNIGYLWFIGEPMMLAIAITLIHSGAGGKDSAAMPAVPFWLGGYTLFIMFRGIVGRAEAAIESNRTLLYHRQVTVLDIIVARALLEGAASMTALVLLLSVSSMLGYGGMPQRPALFIGAYLLLVWFSFGFSMIVAAASEYMAVIARFVHPLLYVSMPLSGAFFVVEWFPRGLREALYWNPLISIFELLREGQFAEFESHYIDLRYVVAWCMPLTIAGLIMIKKARRRMHFD